MFEWFYTAPIDVVAVRRGDPLGMRAVAEEMAEVLAPGLSNRTVDGRWLSIMCWALQQSYLAYSALGTIDADDHVVTRQAAKEIYSWLRPLELLWVARTVAKTKDRGKGRQLPGVRAIRPWVNGEDINRERFGLALSSYSRYRSIGVYGAYRVALRSLPGLTVGGDGWHLGPLGREIAEIGRGEVRCSRSTYRRQKGRRPAPERYWERGFEWNRGRAEFLPTVIAEPRRFASPERELLRRALFSSTEGSDVDRRKAIGRRAVVEAAAKSSATTRAALFADVARALGGGKPPDELALLAPFCELADAGVAAMNACWAAVKGIDGFARASDVLAQRTVRETLNGLTAAASRWQRDSRIAGRRIDIADALARSVFDAGNSRKGQFQALERHHNRFGGGLKWLALEGDTIKPLAPVRGGDASEYGFRIEALSRLGVQAGIINVMPKALRDSDELAGEADGEDES